MNTRTSFWAIGLFVLFGYLLPACKKGSDMSAQEREDWMQKGQEATQIAASTLGGALVKSMGEGGVVHAISFCNEKATVLTDSAGNIAGFPIYRRALKQRNPANKPNQMEETVLRMYGRAAEQNKELKPTLLENGQKQLFYFQPIIMQPLCLGCHGTIGSDINEETFKALQSRYPKDKAFNYKLNDFRGVWVVLLRS